MLQLGEEQRKVLVQAFPAVGHLAVGGLVFGQFLRDASYSLLLATTGIAIWIVCVTVALIIAGGNSWTGR